MELYLIICFVIAFLIGFVYAIFEHKNRKIKRLQTQLDNSNLKNEQLKQELKNAKIRKKLEESDRLHTDDDIDELLEQGGYIREE
ncbi:DUF2681 domain-containing protein [Phocoenobacter skyensis]|uniref:DUF2681 domain-containing protein n=1 Tax=Phocoenobacter skyensis TaxID=97481 RepID=A0ABT9JKR6_9PAST|nr:DUF2681 domain-containing protein [Pasteurella skyensis]MDP8079530.1 DUF2681 domain-containing protein [Pasteurella skyensis]MDP8085402.1 DUF2681 domain-containing protein [Pasteurella skyensis]